MPSQLLRHLFWFSRTGLHAWPRERLEACRAKLQPFEGSRRSGLSTLDCVTITSAPGEAEQYATTQLEGQLVKLVGDQPKNWRAPGDSKAYFCCCMSFPLSRSRFYSFRLSDKLLLPSLPSPLLLTQGRGDFSFLRHALMNVIVYSQKSVGNSSGLACTQKKLLRGSPEEEFS